MTAVRRLPELTDAQWLDVVAAAAPYAPTAQARAAVEECLRNYRGHQRDPAAVREARERWQRVAKLSRALAHELFEIKRRTPWTTYDPDQPRRSLRAVRVEQYRAETNVETLDRLAHAMRGRSDPATEWFYERLFAIWTDEFGGKFRTTQPVDGSPPIGPLVDFVLAVAQHVMEPLPSPHTIRDAMRREQRRRRRT